MCRERELLRQYFDGQGLKGFDYAYLYPGMNKVLQAAGRVIRTDEDRGVILLLDDRFADRRYRETFPREWASYSFVMEKTHRRRSESLGVRKRRLITTKKE